MPLLKGKKNIGRNISELHGGKTYAHTMHKFGKKKADRQAIAIAMNEAGMSRKPGRPKDRRNVRYY